MTDTIRRLVALITYANVALNGMRDIFELERLLSHNCYRMEFIEKGQEDMPGSGKKIASDASNWISTLIESDAQRVLLHFAELNLYGLPDHITAAFLGGGSQWMIEVVYESQSHLYSYGEENSGRLKDQIILLDREFSNPNAIPAVQDMRNKLDSILKSLVEFSGSHDHSRHWATNFEFALHTLEALNVDTPDFLPTGIYSTEAHQLIEAAFSSWVFGGMGSWNDMGFDETDHARYENLTSDLYKTICSSIVAGVNSYP